MPARVESLTSDITPLIIVVDFSVELGFFANDNDVPTSTYPFSIYTLETVYEANIHLVFISYIFMRAQCVRACVVPLPTCLPKNT